MPAPSGQHFQDWYVPVRPCFSTVNSCKYDDEAVTKFRQLPTTFAQLVLFRKANLNTINTTRPAFHWGCDCQLNAAPYILVLVPRPFSARILLLI